MIEIRPVIGEAFVYQVTSERDAEMTYRVDLLENRGNGACSCIDFGTRRQLALDAGAQPHTRATLCKHLIAVRRYFMRVVLEELARIHS